MRIRDWSSDVCSSDLKSELFARAAQWQRASGHSRESISLYLRAGDLDAAAEVASTSMIDIALRKGKVDQIQLWRRRFSEAVSDPTIIVGRSEARRVGNEWVSTCRSRWSPNHSKKE